MELAQAVVFGAQTSPSPGTPQLTTYQFDSVNDLPSRAANDLHNIMLDDVQVRLVKQDEQYPEIARLRGDINLDVQRALDPNFISREKKEMF